MRAGVVPSSPRRSSYRDLFRGWGTTDARGWTAGPEGKVDGACDQCDAERDVEGELAAVADADLESLAEGDEQRHRRREQAAARSPVDHCYQQLNEPGDGEP